MKWEYKTCLFLLLISWTLFLVLAAYFNGNQLYLSQNDIEPASIEYSTIWFHTQYWLISLVLTYAALIFGVLGIIRDNMKSGWKLSNFIKIEIVDDEQT